MGLKIFDEKTLRIGMFMCLNKATSTQQLESIYSRNIDDFEQTVVVSIGKKSDSLNDKLTYKEIETYIKEYYPAFREQMILREPPAEYRWMLWTCLASQSDLISLDQY